MSLDPSLGVTQSIIGVFGLETWIATLLASETKIIRQFVEGKNPVPRGIGFFSPLA
jgi:hypothetical protein